jgi:hypothetical protein
MARIDVKKAKKIEKERNTIHKEVDATYTSFYSRGIKYIQFDTYGSNDRQFIGKISQSIQLDRKSAEELIKLLKMEFSL